nr:GntR family transcriptional regulator [Neobacillus sp. Marseille-Q6967]
MIKNVVKKSMTDQIYQSLRENIITLKFPKDEKININSLKEQFGTSQTPIREALNRLHQEGLVEFISNVGVKVVEFSKKDVLEIIDLCHYLDLYAIRLAMENGKIDELVSDLEYELEEHEKCYQKGDEGSYRHHVSEFHQMIRKHSKNKKLLEVFSPLQAQLDIVVSRYYQIGDLINEDFRDKSFQEHKAIYEAIKDHNASRAIALMDEHYLTTKEMIMSEFDRLNC